MGIGDETVSNVHRGFGYALLLFSAKCCSFFPQTSNPYLFALALNTIYSVNSSVQNFKHLPRVNN